MWALEIFILLLLMTPVVWIAAPNYSVLRWMLVVLLFGAGGAVLFHLTSY